MMSRVARRLITALILILLPILVALLASGLWLNQMSTTIKAALKEKHLVPPVEFYAAPTRIFRGQKIPKKELLSIFERIRYRSVPVSKKLARGDYQTLTEKECEPYAGPLGHNAVNGCLVWRNHSAEEDQPFLALLGSDDIIIDIVNFDTGDPEIVASFEPELFGQFYHGRPILKKTVDLSEVPSLCLNAVIAIEDSEFLHHRGVSPQGILRALVKNVLKGRIAEGGSTITQQLIKNFFLTPERTFSRKFKEMGMALVIEAVATKDEILQAYVNEVYMGQNGPFEVRGYGAASEYYFGKDIENASLKECALLAALVNGPGLYDPFRKPERALQRRKLVLERMESLEMISSEEARRAANTPLPTKLTNALAEPAPYFVDAVKRRLNELEIELKEGLRVYTTLDIHAQDAAQKSVEQGIQRLESDYPQITKLKEQGKVLQALLVSADPLTGNIQSIVGGRSFRVSQFNRAIQSRRQVGSIFKPFVYLAALYEDKEEGGFWSPLDILPDEKHSYEWNQKTWEPENYGEKYFGAVPMYFALSRSLNAATAWLGMKVGLSKIIEVARSTGISSELQEFPSLTLGAFELSPLEVLQAYATFSRLGEHRPLTLIRRVEDLGKTTIYRWSSEKDQVINKTIASVLVGMMKQTIENGTGRSSRLWGFSHPAAGKTGTTSDYRDSWFAGFTPLHTAVAWVGYDDNTESGLTGASGALPVWSLYMKQVAAQYPPVDFSFDEDTTKRVSLPGFRSEKMIEEGASAEPIELILKK